MARARLIKPAFFSDSKIAKLHPVAQLLFIGLWTLADRRGRLVHDVAWIRAQVFPYQPTCRVDVHVKSLTSAGAIVCYNVQGQEIIWICHFEKHQRPHQNESESVLPPPPPVADEVYFGASPSIQGSQGFALDPRSFNLEPLTLNPSPRTPDRRVERELRFVESWPVNANEDEDDPPIAPPRDWKAHRLNFSDEEWAKLIAAHPGLNVASRWREWVLWIEEEEREREPKNKYRAFEGFLKLL